MITGATYPATKDGFIELIKDANEKKKRNIKLLSVLKLDKTIAALYEESDHTVSLV